MKKIISLFKRDYDGNRLVYDEVVPGAEWVLASEGWATRKWDGTCCMVQDGKLFKRYDAKKGKTPPPGFVPAQEPDAKSGHWPGWLAVGDGPDDRWFREAWEWALEDGVPADGTYELVGPKVQGNPDSFACHELIPHGETLLPDVPRTFDGLKQWLAEVDIEGVVWHRENGDMVKIKGKDFGLRRGIA